MNKNTLFAVIAHIDHGKSTFCDSLIGICNTDFKRGKAPTLDSHDIERERGVTIRNHYIELEYQGNLVSIIDTPGHHDFGQYTNIAVSLVDNIMVLIDVTKGIQAQTIKYLDLAVKKNKKIYYFINKIDLDKDGVLAHELEQYLRKSAGAENIFYISGKCGSGVQNAFDEVMKTAVTREIKKPVSKETEFYILDTIVDEYKHTEITVLLKSGSIKEGEHMQFEGRKHHIRSIKNVKCVPENCEETDISRIYKIFINGKVGSTISMTGAIYNNGKLTNMEDPYKPVLYKFFRSNKLDRFQETYKELCRVLLTEPITSVEIVSHPIYIQVIKIGLYGNFHHEIFMQKLSLNNVPVSSVEMFTSFFDTELNKVITMPDEKCIQNNYNRYLSRILSKFDIITIQCKGEYYSNVISKLNFNCKTIQIISIEHIGDSFIMQIKIASIELETSNFINLLKGATSGYCEIIFDDTCYEKVPVSLMELEINGERVAEFSQIVIKDLQEKQVWYMLGMIEERVKRQQYNLFLRAVINKKPFKTIVVKQYRKDVAIKAKTPGDTTRKNKLLDKQKAGKAKLAANFDINKIKPDLFK